MTMPETTRDYVAWFARPNGRKAIFLVAIAAVIAVALLNRTYFLIYRGGLALDQQAWATQNYYGGITRGYLLMRDSILSWKAETLLWSYLPGYPFLLAIFSVAGIKDLSVIRFIQVVIDTLAILPLYFVLIRLGKSAYLAIFGCLIYAAAPWWSAGSTYLLADALVPALFILLLAAMVLVRDHPERAANWFLLGLLAAILPFFRSEMVLLFGPLGIWALLVAPKRKRLSSVACVIAGFVLPLLLWALRNYYVHGQFMLTPPAKWYAAWSGLGQVANDYGYFVSDARAADLLASKGIRYHSLEAEKYWFGEYLRAWITHPEHVIKAIFYRFHLILRRIDTQSVHVSRVVLALYGAMAFFLPVGLIWLIRARRIAEAFLIALPMLYALGSLGLLYVEARYVRYAGLTYLLILPVIFDVLAKLLRTGGFRQRLGVPRHVVVAIGVLGFITLGSATALQLILVRNAATNQGLSDRLNVNAVLAPTSSLENISFKPAVPGVETAHSEAGLELRANAPVGRYLLMAPIGARKDGSMIVRYRITQKRGGAGFGVLSAGGVRWLSQHWEAGEAGKEIEGAFTSVVETGSELVIFAAGTKPGTDVLISRLEWTLVCPEPINLLDLLLSKTMIEPRSCSAEAGP